MLGWVDGSADEWIVTCLILGCGTELWSKFEACMGDAVAISSRAIEEDPIELPTSTPDWILHLLQRRRPEPTLGWFLGIDTSSQNRSQHSFLGDPRLFLDLPHPWLDGRTPREAAQDPVARPNLLILAKALVNRVDDSNLNQGTSKDINWMLRELDLHEIDIHPPPWRPAILDADLEDMDEDKDEDEDE